jgi:TRAP-type transport system periplasmic protein
MKTRIGVFILFIMAAFLIGIHEFSYGAPVTLKQGTMYPESSNYGKAMNRFSELAKQYSNGEIKLEVFHGGQLGKKAQLVENIQRGAMDVYIETIDVFETYIPECYFQSMSYMFKDVDHMRKFYRSDWFEKNIHAKFKARGTTFIPQKYTWERGPYRVLVTRIPITTVDDMKKIKLRVYESEVYKLVWQALGANTTMIDWTEVYLALKQNTIQGVTSPIDLVRPQKFTEVAKYITRIDEFPQVLLVMMNIKSLEKLNPSQKEAIQKAADEAGAYFTKMNADGAEIDIAAMLEEDGASFSRPPLAKWREKVSPFYKQLENDGKVQKGFYDMVQGLLK